ncbi:F0F1 ATP synthase subunit delta [Lactobacillus sp. S2-2]|uniref:ATP synthase F1 subunit delta n=1 Tax=Lactobacillus sp. S2-2 TaxID=2692917 RepID=UPI001F424E8E|nr:ATP synthase F1 subunit delta [Lactobacillus sp. S2-2]MCF6515767.1 F0F1 ATP synthase subunit delta [Lactobacillus sp. S2-2]
MALDKITASKRYASALFSVLQSNNQLEDGIAELKEVRNIITDNPTFITALSTVTLTESQKHELLNNLLDNISSEYVKRCIEMVYEYGRINDMVAIIDEVSELNNKNNGIVQAEAVTAIALDDDQIEKLKASFAKRIGANTVELTTKIDENIIGGVVMNSANFIYDGSIRTKINRVRQLLSK